MIFSLQNQFLKAGKKIQAKTFFGIGSKENSGTYRMVDDLNHFMHSFSSYKNGGFVINLFVFQDENHDTVFPAALTKGMMFVFGKEKTLANKQ